MEAKQPMPSVIARLMGFDEISPPSQPVCRPHRVLSEDYLRKSDSICVLERGSYRKRRLSKVSSQTGQRIVSSMEVQGREKLHRNSIDSVQQRSSIERGYRTQASSKIVSLGPVLGKSKFEMMLKFFSTRKNNNQLWEKWKIHKGTNEIPVTRRSNAGTNKLGSNIEKGNCDENSCGDSNLSSFVRSCTELEYENLTEETKATQETPRKSSEKSQSSEISAENLKMSSDFSEEKRFQPTHCSIDTKGPYNFEDILTGEDSSASSSCPKIDPEFHLIPGEYFSPSPNSVLDTLFTEELLSSSDSFDGIGADPDGLEIQSRLSESESEETRSEGNGMVVSSDEDSGHESVDCYNVNTTFSRFSRPEECRDSSYIIDVLDETSFFDSNTDLGSKERSSLDCPLDPSLFELLEKKYDKHSSWDKAERRLLFDRINLGLKDILYPQTKPLGKKFKLSQSREVIEDEIWRLLLSQENGVNRTLSEKALGTEAKWFDLQDDIDFIVCEIEQFLFEELSAELLFE